MKVFLRVGVLSFLLAFVCNPAKAVPVEAIGIIVSIAGDYLKNVNAKQHNQLTKDYADAILNAIYQVNQAIAGLKKQTCDIYRHQLFQDFDAFKFQVSLYTGAANRGILIDDLQSLKFYATEIRKNFEDHQKIVDCAINQYDTYQLYLALASLELNLNYEYISMQYKLAYLRNPDGTLRDISTLDPATRNTLETLINADVQPIFKLIVADVLKHIKILDGSTGLFSWKSHTDKLFSISNVYLTDLSSPITSIFQNLYTYKFKNVDYTVKRRFSTVCTKNWFGKETCTQVPSSVSVYDHCKVVFLIQSGNCSEPSTESYFNFLTKSSLQSYYLQNPGEIFNGHKIAAYMMNARMAYEPTIPIVKSWVNTIEDGSVVYPNLNVDKDLQKYVEY